MHTSSFTPRRYAASIGALVALHIVAQLWVLSQRFFYWDDLIIIGRTWEHSIFSTEFLLHHHDGHLAPGAFFIAGLCNHLAALQWWLPVVVMVTLSTLALLASGLALQSLTSPRCSVRLFALMAVSPPIMVAATWWSAALNATVLQLCLSIAVWATVACCRTYELKNRSWHLSAGLAAAVVGSCTVVGLLFFEKSLLIVPVCALIMWLRSDSREAFIQRQPIWIVGGLITAVGAFIYWAMAWSTATEATGGTNLPRIGAALYRGLFPALVGGPLNWDRWTPSQVWGTPPHIMSIAGGLLLVIGVAYVVTQYRGAWRLALAAALIILPTPIALATIRSSSQVSDVLVACQHYYADTVVILALAVAAVLGSREPKRTAHTPPSSKAPPRELLTTGVVAIVMALSCGSIITYGLAWQGDPVRDYVATARETLAQHRSEPLLDQPLPLEVLEPIAHPTNTTHHLFGGLPQDQRPPLTRATTQPWMLTPSGEYTAAALLPLVQTVPGPEPQCGWRVATGQTVLIPTEQLIKLGQWVFLLNAAATAEGVDVNLSLPNALESAQVTREGSATATVTTQPNQQWVQIRGGGDALRVTADGPAGASVCIGVGQFGVLQPVSAS